MAGTLHIRLPCRLDPIRRGRTRLAEYVVQVAPAQSGFRAGGLPTTSGQDETLREFEPSRQALAILVKLTEPSASHAMGTVPGARGCLSHYYGRAPEGWASAAQRWHENLVRFVHAAPRSRSVMVRSML
jgi:hypothetical protein